MLIDQHWFIIIIIREVLRDLHLKDFASIYLSHSFTHSLSLSLSLLLPLQLIVNLGFISKPLFLPLFFFANWWLWLWLWMCMYECVHFNWTKIWCSLMFTITIHTKVSSSFSFSLKVQTPKSRHVNQNWQTKQQQLGLTSDTNIATTTICLREREIIEIRQRIRQSSSSKRKKWTRIIII